MNKKDLFTHWLYVHVYNRGVDKRNIFLTDIDYERFMLTMRVVILENARRVSEIIRLREKQLLASISQAKLNSEYGPNIVELLAFCLMPNHFHIVLRSENQRNIWKFAQRLGNSYTRFFNTKYQRKGRLFESKYQFVEISTDEQFVHVIRYVHVNPSRSSRLHLTSTQLKQYMWSSLPAYLTGFSKMCNVAPVMDHFETIDDFWKFTEIGTQDVESVDSLGFLGED